MLSAHRIPKKHSGGLTPVLPLICETTIATSETERSMYISFDLKARVAQNETSTKYKKYVRKFDEGSPQKWIDLVKDITEIWTQNSIAGGTDRASTVRALVRGESLTAFEAALQTARTDAAGVEAQLTQAHVQTALDATAVTVFPHRALEIQRLWMNRSMFKPRTLSTRATSAAISRINNALPMFPRATDANKFPETELLALLEWSLPSQWRETFDLKGYIPTAHDRQRLIQECEAIERHSKPEDSPKETENKGNNKKKKNRNENSGRKSQKGDQASGLRFYCTEHGKNPTHNTNKCNELIRRKEKERRQRDNNGNPNRSFSKNAFRKEINMFSRKSSKSEVLDMYESTIQGERKKIAKRKAKRAAVVESSSDESDSDVSHHNIEPVNVKKRSNPTCAEKPKPKNR